MSRFDAAHMISYYRSVVTIWLYCLVSFPIYSQVLVTNREIYMLYLYTTPKGWNFPKFPVGILRICLVLKTSI